jgi:ATP-dependent RNA helicase DDX21
MASAKVKKVKTKKSEIVSDSGLGSPSTDGKKRKAERAAAAAPATAVSPSTQPAIDDEAAAREAKRARKAERAAKKATPGAAAAAAPTDSTGEGDAAQGAATKGAAAAAAAAGDANALDNFALADSIKSLLRSKDIESLFPIQAACFDVVVSGADVVGRARTGCGKTLAFVLPIVQSLVDGAPPRRAFGRPPAVIVLAPTRELAKQVCRRLVGLLWQWSRHSTAQHRTAQDIPRLPSPSAADSLRSSTNSSRSSRLDCLHLPPASVTLHLHPTGAC